MKRMNRVIAFSALAALSLTLNPIQAGAYGETTEKSTLTADTKAVSEYQTWKDSTWTGKESIDSGKIVLTPGATEKDLNFCWYSKTKGLAKVKLGKKEDLSDAKVYDGTVTDINRSNSVETYKASNKVSIKGALEKNTTYYYNYSNDGTTWSKAEKYQTKDFSSYKIWLVGDQIDYAAADEADTKNVRESEYAGFLYPSVLRNLPLASSIGNHESKGTDYKYHYNNPNTEDNLGATNSGSDYYFSYGDVLYIILNSNNRNAAEHSKLMEKAIESAPNAKWKVVAFHHDIYGSGQPHSDFDGANLRTIFAPLMDKYDIDVCLTGHDHSYARTYQIIDGTALLPDLTTKIPVATYDTAYENLKKAVDNVEYKVVSSYGDDDLDLDDDQQTAQTVVKKASLTIKKGKKSIAGKTVKLKKGKSFKITAKRTNTTKKVTYTSSNKKYVKVNAAGKVTAKKYTKKTVTITVKAGTLKKTFKVKVTR